MNFANPDVVVQSWFVACNANELPVGQARTLDLLGRRITVYRGSDGRPHALDARCPHLGADLGQGTVHGDLVRCALHAWEFGPDGHCTAAPSQDPLPSRVTRAYPVEERWGKIWIFNGPKPSFPLPGVPGGGWTWQLFPPPQHIEAHPHLVVGNGLDAYHFPILHRMNLTAEPAFEQGERHITLKMTGHPKDGWVRWLTGTTSSDFVASFTCIGGSMSWASVEAPIRTHALFTGRPTPDGGCETTTILFLRSRSPLYLQRTIALWAFLLRDDRRILDTMVFRPAFTPADEGMKRLYDLINAMPTF
jgi:aminopyrrolnitrin oxygenase